MSRIDRYPSGGIVLDEALAGGKVDDEDIVGPVRVGLAERAQGHGFACEHEEGCLGLERRGHEASDRDALPGKVFYLVGKLEPEDAAPAVQFVEREFRRRRFRRTRQAEQGKKEEEQFFHGWFLWKKGKGEGGASAGSALPSAFSYLFPSARASDMIRKTSVLFMKPRKASA